MLTLVWPSLGHSCHALRNSSVALLYENVWIVQGSTKKRVPCQAHKISNPNAFQTAGTKQRLKQNRGCLLQFSFRISAAVNTSGRIKGLQHLAVLFAA